MEEPMTNGSVTEPLQNHVENGVNEMKEGHGEKKEHRDKSHSSSSSSHKHHSSSSKHKHKDKDRDREKDKHRSSSSHKSSHGDKEKHSSSSSKHSSSKSSHKDKHRDKDKHRSSSSSHKDGEKKHSSSSSSKHSSSDKDRHSSSSKDKHSSSHKSSHSDKHRDKDKHRDEKHKSKSSSSGESKPKAEEPKPKPEVKSEPITPSKIKQEPRADMSDDDMPLSARMDTSKVKAEKRPIKEEDSDDEPLSARMEKKKVKQEKVEKSKKRKTEDDDDFSPIEKKKKKKEIKKAPAPSPMKKGGTASPTKKGKKEEGTEERWRWWEEEEKEDGVKWNFLEHKGPVFAPPYEPLPHNVRFYYDGKPMKLSQDTEEVAGFYGRMLDHDYTTRPVFNENFLKDWRRVMNSKEREIIKDMSRCNFQEIDVHFKQKSEERKAMSKEEKKANKEQNEELAKEYGFCIMDGHKEKMGNFKIEPPGLFRGRGDHPKQGMLKRRVMPEDIIINCSRDSKIPVPPEGHKWKEVRHDNQVTWLASWTENVQNQTKYVMLAPTSKLKGSKDWKKYEMARSLHTKVDKIRAGYREDLKSKEMRIRQRAVAMYFIDKLALRAGNEKDEDTADTVGCCSLRYEHIKLHDEMDGKQFVVEFDFLGKDSIRYHNTVPVDKRVYKNLKMFMDNKNDGDDLFDRLNTAILNKHLNTLMEGLTAKVFRTYNASRTLQEQLDLLTEPEDAIPAKILAYNRANRSVAILCNHQRAVPKTFGKQMENLQNKIEAKKDSILAAKKEYKQAKSDHKSLKSEKTRAMAERKKKTVERLEDQLTKLEIQLTDKDENKEIALGTSKLNYLDPRISVAWCKKWEVPIEKVYNKTQREKFAWAIDMADADYKFTEVD